MTDVIRVLIADDHVHQRLGIQRLLSLQSDIHVVGEAQSAQEAVDKAIELRPDVVLLDLVWFKDRRAGISAIQQIKKRDPTVRILAVTAYTELIDQARQAGAEVAIDKDTLYDAITLSSRIRDASRAQSLPLPSDDEVEPLSEREFDVLVQIARDNTDQQIADELSLALPTVKKHVSSILRKLGAGGRGGAVAVAFERGLLPRRGKET